MGGEIDPAFFHFEKREDTAAAAERMFHAMRAHPLVEQGERLTSFQFGANRGRSCRPRTSSRTKSRKRVFAILADDTWTRWQYDKDRSSPLHRVGVNHDEGRRRRGLVAVNRSP
jgi:hypothetical protein